MKYKFLDQINFPDDLRNVSINDLNQVAEELRHKTIEAVSKTGGHLGAGLGVIELTIALHYIFDTPKDKIIWDVGHQAYPHKILTGRKHQIETLRKENGLYGFVKRSESEYDTFGTAHSSTSISAGLGIKIALELKKDNSKVVCVIGDGALSAGMAYEALNNAGAMSKELIVVLNDNDMSIDQPVGAMSSYLSKLLSSNSYSNIRSIIKKISNKLIKDGLKNFQGVQRRFTKLFSFQKVPFFDDYAHHPTAIREVLNGAKEVYKNKEIVCIFQPHRISRLKILRKDFSKAFILTSLCNILSTLI